MSTDFIPIPIKIQKKTNIQSSQITSETPYIARPMNPFMCFAKFYRPLLQKQFKINSNISKELGIKWNQMSLEQKMIYKKQADEIKKAHIKKYPFYKYKPRTKLKKIRKMPVHGKIETYKPPVHGKIETYKPSVPILKKKSIPKKKKYTKFSY